MARVRYLLIFRTICSCLDHCVEEGGRARYLSVSSLVVTTAVNVFALKLQNFLTLIMFSVRRFGKGTKKLALTNHGQFIEDELECFKNDLRLVEMCRFSFYRCHNLCTFLRKT